MNSRANKGAGRQTILPAACCVCNLAFYLGILCCIFSLWTFPGLMPWHVLVNFIHFYATCLYSERKSCIFCCIFPLWIFPKIMLGQVLLNPILSFPTCLTSERKSCIFCCIYSLWTFPELMPGQVLDNFVSFFSFSPCLNSERKSAHGLCIGHHVLFSFVKEYFLMSFTWEHTSRCSDHDWAVFAKGPLCWILVHSGSFQHWCRQTHWLQSNILRCVSGCSIIWCEGTISNTVMVVMNHLIWDRHEANG